MRLVLTTLLLLGGIACAHAVSTGAARSHAASLDEPPGGKEVVGVPFTLPGYENCTPSQASCTQIEVSQDFYFALTGDTRVAYPADVHLPPCPSPKPDPGIPIGETSGPSSDNAPECAVSPREKITELYLTPASTAAFSGKYHCGLTEADPCQRRDIP
jgi:hypothetical protein